jgi:hypothetical protein
MVPPPHHEAGDDEHQHQDKGRRAERPRQPAHVVAEHVGAAGVEPRPEQRAGDVEQLEAGPGHSVGPRQERGQRAQDRHEPPEEDDFPAMPQEQVLAEFQPGLGEADITAVAQRQLVAGRAADPEPRRAAEDGADGGRHEQRGQPDTVGCAGIDSGADQRRLARQRQAQALQRDQAGDHPDAVGVDEMGQILMQRCEHLSRPRLRSAGLADSRVPCGARSKADTAPVRAAPAVLGFHPVAGV